MENYHTHTRLCKHAEGMPADYCEVAAQKGFTKLGFTDHTPLPDELKPFIRMEREQLHLYIDEVKKARELYPQLEIFLGLECDYMPRYEWYYRDFMMDAMKMDYLIGSVHYYDFRGEIMWFDKRPMEPLQYMIYADLYVKAMESGLFTFMAHPDLYCTNVYKWDENAKACAKTILEAAKDLNMILEINTSGFEKMIEAKDGHLPYPREDFWEMASDYNISVVVNSDAHKPSRIDSYFDEGYRIMEKYSLKKANLNIKRQE